MRVTDRNIMAVYGRGCERMGGDINWEAVSSFFEKGTKAVTTLVETGKTLFGPTEKAQQNVITGGSPVTYVKSAVAATPSWVPMAIGAGALGLVAILIMKR